MLRDLFGSIWESLRHRIGPRPQTSDYTPTHDEELAALGRHNDAEARIVGRTMADPGAIRSFGKGRPR